ncbi:hypothetical protein [Bradyrhizobium sp. USDA 241]|uniref:hypothetical protein n=1 Tax=Bradyrhizobium sp. USDA 241 TaxID=3377725 RepID=UPI003C758AD1
MPVLMSVLMHGTSVPRVVKSTRESRSSRPPKRGGVVVPLSIKVRTDLPDLGFAETLEHEINHACWDAAKLKSRASEETVVNRLTPVMMMARRDNPEIYAWIDQAIAQKE